LREPEVSDWIGSASAQGLSIKIRRFLPIIGAFRSVARRLCLLKKELGLISCAYQANPQFATSCGRDRRGGFFEAGRPDAQTVSAVSDREQQSSICVRRATPNFIQPDDRGRFR
jgi:hypothetical protein